MINYPNINPVAIDFGMLKVYWYGIMYLLAFVAFMILGRYRIKRYANIYVDSVFNNKKIDDFVIFSTLGVVIGGRLGYCLFYRPLDFILHPLEIFNTLEGGMSFHGGLIGMVIAVYLFARVNKRTFFEVSDFVVPIAPIGIFFGRIGNFINGELWGRVVETKSIPWAMIFPYQGDNLPRHPSQIYEALGEGVLLFVILWNYANKKRKRGQITGLFLLSYGLIRFFIEFFREPDYFLTYLVDDFGISMGQILCIPMIVCGIIVYYTSCKRMQQQDKKRPKKYHKKKSML